MESSDLPIFTALGHPIRWKTFELLLANGCGSMIPSEIADAVGTYRNLISTHLKIMREAGLLSSEKRGREVHYTVQPAAARALAQQMLEVIDASAKQD